MKVESAYEFAVRSAEHWGGRYRVTRSARDYRLWCKWKAIADAIGG